MPFKRTASNGAPVSEASPFNSPPVYGYSINLDERGDFYADVRNGNGKTVFEIKSGDSLGEDESSILEDGFMKDKHDLDGLGKYLRSLGVMPKTAVLATLEAQDTMLAEQEAVKCKRAPRPR